MIYIEHLINKIHRFSFGVCARACLYAQQMHERNQMNFKQHHDIS